MATALMDQDVRTEREDMARSSRKKTLPPHAYADWQKPNGWKVDKNTLSDLTVMTDRLDFTGIGTTGSPGSLQVTRTDPVTHKTTVIDWGTNVVFDSGTDSVTLDHVKPASAGGATVTLMVTHDSGTKSLSCTVVDNWRTRSSRRRRGHGHGHGAVDVGSWTAVEG